MRVKKLRLKNGYKRFLDLTIDLGNSPKRIVALVGPNGCGKSSVLDGMLFLVSNFANIGDGGRRGYTYHSMLRLPHFDTNNVELTFDEGPFQKVFQQRRGSGEDKPLFSFRSSYRYNNTLMINQTQAVPELRTNNYGASVSSDLDAKMERNYRQLNIKFSNYRDANNLRPSDAKDAIIGELNRSIRSCLDLEIISLGNIEASQGTLYFKKPDHPRDFEFNVLSAGEKEVIDILLDMYLRKDVFDDSIFLLDEPELHINTAIQRKLLIEINRLLPPKCQLWVATHSLGFLRAIQDEFKNDCQVIDFSEAKELAAKAYTLTPIHADAAKWRQIFEVALDDLAHLISPKRIVYCEGRDLPGKSGEERGIDAKVFNTIFGEKYHDTLFVSSGGNTELDQRSDVAILILSKVFSSLEILVLKDRDMASGKQTLERDRQIYLQNQPRSHRVLRRWEVENYLYDKEVLKKYCSLNGLEFDESAYDAFVTDIHNQNVKEATGRIKNLCGIKTSINPEVFKQRLAECVDERMETYKELEACIFHRA